MAHDSDATIYYFHARYEHKEIARVYHEPN